ncbi:RagB/SusD family nutrient uptake outer membrane protein [uncultured Bacteroides sp.]|uniref:RagB/SusD family nutrient uptake outer membrane protein n=1 Tax=uncultured Bacteroides sp. TaxID=162156 RepID=UPI0026126096|nr:RagB/SusD family nutrient uptake outer membrane protein [uncultured Bacteroides sp.]
MKTKYILSSLFLGFLSMSCADFLEEIPYNKVTQGNYFTTAEGIKGGINGLYGSLRDIYNTENFMNFAESETDITIWPSSAARQPVFADNGYVTGMWNTFYNCINRCNEVIQSLEKNNIPGLSDDLKNRYLGEAKFIRAHIYAHLVKQWEDIPMPLTPTVGIVTKAPKTQEKDVWVQILADLEFAKNNLPESYPADTDYGRITKYAALHELALSLLTCKRDDPASLELAQQYAEEVIKCPNYELMESTWNLWDMSYVRNNKEVIFAICYSKDNLLNGSGNQSHMYFVADYTQHKGLTRSLEYGRPWIRVKPTRYAYELYLNPELDDEANNKIADRRAKDWFLTDWKINSGKDYTETLFSPYTKQDEKVTIKNGELAMIACPWYNTIEAAEYAKQFWPVWVWIPDHMEQFVKETGGIQSKDNPNGIWPSNVKFCKILFYPYLRKHLDPTRIDANYAQGSRDVFVYRLADTYLLAAEAAFLRNDKETAAKYINVVRERAARPEFKEAIKITADQVTADFILDERGRELIGEMKRRNDLKRFGVYTKRMTELHDKIWYLDPAYEFEEYMEKRPYPRSFLLSIENPEDFKNAPGYGN